MQFRFLAGAILTLVLQARVTDAQSPADPRSLPANTVVELETAETVSSRDNKPGDFFQLRVSTDVTASRERRRGGCG